MQRLDVILCTVVVWAGIAWASPLDKKTVEGPIKEATAGYVRMIDQLKGTDLTIEVDPQTRYQGVRRPTELQEGDQVNIQYSENDLKKTAAKVTKLKITEPNS
jgi:hypothetical protein